MDTLILNADYRPLSLLPLSIVDWELAIKLVALGKVSVIKEYDDWEVHSPSITVKVPSIVVTTGYVNWKKDVKYSRSNVLLRDKFTCQLCGKSPSIKELTLDHVKPRSLGGITSWTNIVAACRGCNSRKGNDHNIRPKHKPYRPSYYQLAALRQALPVTIREVEWRTYLPWDEHLIYVHPRNGKTKLYTTFLGEKNE